MYKKISSRFIILFLSIILSQFLLLQTVAFSQSGIPISTSAAGQERPVAAFDGTNYLVVWEEDNGSGVSDIYGVFVSPSGIVAGSDFAIRATAYNKLRPEVYFDGTNYLVAWFDYRNGAADIYGQLISPSGTAVGPEIAISTAAGSQFKPDIGFDGTNYLVVWRDNRGGVDFDIYGQFITTSGILSGSNFAISTATGNQQRGEVVFDGTNYLVVWDDYRSGVDIDIYGQFVTTSGTLSGSDFAISTSAGGQISAGLDFDGSNYLVAWRDDRSGTGSDVYAQRLTATGVLLGSEFMVSTATGRYRYPTEVLFNGTDLFLIVWHDCSSPPCFNPANDNDIYGQFVTTSGALYGSEIAISTAPVNEYAPHIAFDGINYLAVWGDHRNGADYDIYGRLIGGTSTATKVGTNVTVFPVDSTTGEAPVSVTFDNVTSGGTTTLTTSSTGTPIPGFKVGDPPTFYNILTTATFTGQVEVCIDYSGISFTDESALKLFHYEDADADGIDDRWVDRTSSHTTVEDTICAIVNSLSDFAIAEPSEITVDIDIKPGSYPNSINLMAEGVIPVAILTTAEFDASAVDTSLDLNGEGKIFFSGASAKIKGKSGSYSSFEDVDGDGDVDLVIHFYVSAIDSSMCEADGYATVTGQTTDGTIIRGRDTVHCTSPTPTPAEQTVLEGSWKSGCVDEGENSWSETHTFTDNTFTVVVYEWLTNNCTGPVDSTKTLAGTFTIGGEVTTPSGIANKLDATISSPAPEVVKTIFQIDTVLEPDILYFGDDDEGAPRDADGYPTTLQDRPRLKQTILEGSWKSGCVSEDISSWIETHTFTGNTITGVAEQWSSNNTCSGPVESTETFAGTFTIGGEVTTSLGIGNKLDAIIISSPVPEVIKTIFYIDTVSEPDILYVGDDLGPIDAEGYPTTLQTYRPRLKQDVPGSGTSLEMLSATGTAPMNGIWGDCYGPGTRDGVTTTTDTMEAFTFTGSSGLRQLLSYTSIDGSCSGVGTEMPDENIPFTITVDGEKTVAGWTEGSGLVPPPAGLPETPTVSTFTIDAGAMGSFGLIWYMDDRTMPWKIYRGDEDGPSPDCALDANGYPSCLMIKDPLINLSGLVNYTIGGTVSGLTGTGLVLQNNGYDDLTITADGSFTFASPVADNSGYNVTVLSQPTNQSQTCTVNNGSGTVGGANITDVTVTCFTHTYTYTIGGTVTGLTGTGLVLQNNDSDDLTITTGGDFTFATAMTDGSGYNVTVLSQPTNPSQTCTVNNGSGTVGGADITDVTVICSNNDVSAGVSVYVGDGDTEEYYIYGANEGLLNDYENWYSVDQAPSAILIGYAPNGGNLQAQGDYRFYIIASPKQIQVDAIELGVNTGIYLEAGASWTSGNLFYSNIEDVYGEPDGLTVSVGRTIGGSGGTYSGFIIIENLDYGN